DGLSFCQRPTSRSKVWRDYFEDTRSAQAWISHAATCKLAWVCPMCGAARARVNQNVIERSIRGWKSLGSNNRAALMTLTVRHKPDQSLAELLQVLIRGFTLMMGSRFANKCREQDVYFGFIRAVEITWSPRTGWHPHIHALVFTSNMAALEAAWHGQTDKRGRRRGFREEWVKQIQRASVEKKASRPVTPMARRQDLREADLDDAGQLAGYVTKDGVKWSIAAELSRADVKAGRVDSLAPLQLLLAAGDGDQDKRALWREYVRATKGVHRISSSSYDFASRTTLTDHLQREFEKHEEEQARIEAGVGDDPRAIANREAIEAQELARRARSAEERLAADAREHRLEVDSWPRREEIASFTRSEQLSGRSGRMTVAQMNGDLRPLYGLLDMLEADDRVRVPWEAVNDYINEHGLPIDPNRPWKRIPRGEPGPWTVYAQQAAQFEERLEAASLDEDRKEYLRDRFETRNKPESKRYWPRERIRSQNPGT
ncbi:MAG: Replication protein, partial [Solirubrobacterales bacterium]|nr:Replication protein [Solirubrobacterales bacterium]